MFYTYAHYRADDSRIFYIGKGTTKYSRHTSHKNRNLHWHNVVNKHGLQVKVLAHWSDENDAFEHEKFLIKIFRELGHPLTNISSGGEGSSGRVVSESVREKLRQANIGKKQSPESIERTRQSNIGRKHSPEWIENARKALIGRKATAEARKNMSNAHKGQRREYQDVPVRCIEHNVVFPSVSTASTITGAQKGNIVKVCKGQRTKTIGLTFEYINE